MAQLNSSNKIDYMKAHGILGHPGRDLLLGTAGKLGWTLSEKNDKNCKDCMKGKAKRMAINKEAKNKSTIAGERIMIDISSVKSEEEMKRVGKFWLLMVDEATDMKWSFFLRSKGAQVPLLVGFFKRTKRTK